MKFSEAESLALSDYYRGQHKLIHVMSAEGKSDAEIAAYICINAQDVVDIRRATAAQNAGHLRGRRFQAADSDTALCRRCTKTWAEHLPSSDGNGSLCPTKAYRMHETSGIDGRCRFCKVIPMTMQCFGDRDV